MKRPKVPGMDAGAARMMRSRTRQTQASTRSVKAMRKRTTPSLAHGGKIILDSASPRDREHGATFRRRV